MLSSSVAQLGLAQLFGINLSKSTAKVFTDTVHRKNAIISGTVLDFAGIAVLALVSEESVPGQNITD